MLRAGWSSWRACLLWGIATLAVSQSFAFFMPSALAHPVPSASITNPVLAFEFARTPAHLDAVFGFPGDPLRAGRIAGMMRGNVLDYLFMVVYGSFVLAFFGASARETEERRWWIVGWLGPLAAISDAAAMTANRFDSLGGETGRRDDWLDMILAEARKRGLTPGEMMSWDGAEEGKWE